MPKRESYSPKTNDHIDYSKIDPETGEIVQDKHGREMPDPEPMQPPLGYNRQPTLAEQIRAQIVSAKLAMEAEAAGAETFEEADDFDVGDDWEAEKNSPYEANFDPMTAEEKAALSTRGKDPDRILTAEEKDSFTPKPKKTKPSSDQDDDVIADPEGKASKASSLK